MVPKSSGGSLSKDLMNKTASKTSKVIGINNNSSAAVMLIMRHVMNWTSFWRSSVTKRRIANEVDI